MAIRIPTATDAGLGQRLPEVVPHPVKKVLPEYVAPPLAPPPNLDRIGLEGSIPLAKGRTVSKGLMDIGGLGLDLAIMQDAHEKRVVIINKIRAEKTLEEEARSKANMDFIGFKGGLHQKVNDIIDDRALDSEKKLLALKNTYERARGEAKDIIPSRFAADFAPALETVLANEETRFLGHLKQQAEDSVKADTQKVLALFETQAANGQMKLDKAIEQAGFALEVSPYDEVQKTALAKTFVSQVYKNDVAYRRNAGDVNGLLTDLTAKDKDGNPLAYPGMDPTERQEYISTTLHYQKAKEGVWRDETKDLLELYKDQKLSGLPTSEMEKSLGRRVKGTPYESVFYNIKTKGESAAYILAKTEEDPLTFGAARLGIVVKPLNITDPSGMQAAIEERNAIAAKVKAAMGLDYLPVLTGGEVKSLTAYMKKDLEGAGIKLMEGFARFTGPDGVPGMARQIAREDKHVATVMRLVADGDSLTAKDVAKGWGYMESKAATMPKELDIKAGFDEFAGKAINSMPDSRDAAYEAFKAFYANLAVKGGRHDGVYDEDMASAAFKRIVGNVVWHNGIKTLIPKGFEEEDFLNSVRFIDTRTVSASGGVQGIPDDVAAERIRDEGRLYSKGGNLYGVIIGGVPLYRLDGKPFTFALGRYGKPEGER